MTLTPPTRQIYTISDRITDFLQHIITQDAPTTILLICTTKEQFLEQLLLASGQGTEEHHQHNHILTKNTIGVLSKSSSIKLVYCPTLEHLRAYLSVVRSPEDGVGLQRELLTTTAEEKGRQTKQPSPPPPPLPLMAILNPLALHVPTSEFSAQGLSRTFAAVVEVADRGGMDLVLCECRNVGDSMESGSGKGEGEVSWHTQVPLLNSSVRVGEQSTSYRGGGVPVKRVVQRWFEFNDNEAPITDTTMIDV
ncbi:hypothetical protein BO83DRAFT_456799 [Aspergillus eucalypticola CBS 122712]|uniref:Uncharacterized protein n=1 Tax=Aspergillus eucalypticola (strain CBS 122712 / IBT 29274) TaxID=1448314 RepID=A0A317USX1_ASPEC|nr:uncharacterized protein BO83DRAFT_456799 [Aspergillus eucalypticola CBS 122712]PWY63180.1 hypothetical protein BO83DRAFT_456799 [Aspergillus eucalypticola CBS 122712]